MQIASTPYILFHILAVGFVCLVFKHIFLGNLKGIHKGYPHNFVTAITVSLYKCHNLFNQSPDDRNLGYFLSFLIPKKK